MTFHLGLFWVFIKTYRQCCGRTEEDTVRYAVSDCCVYVWVCVCVCVLDGNMTFLPSWVEREMGSLMDFIRRISGMRCVNEKSSFYSIRKWDFVVAFWCDVGEREWEWGERLTTVNVGGHHLCN